MGANTTALAATALFLQRMLCSAGKWLTTSTDLHQTAKQSVTTRTSSSGPTRRISCMFFFFPAQTLHTCCHAEREKKREGKRRWYHWDQNGLWSQTWLEHASCDIWGLSLGWRRQKSSINTHTHTPGAITTAGSKWTFSVTHESLRRNNGVICRTKEAARLAVLPPRCNMWRPNVREASDSRFNAPLVHVHKTDPLPFSLSLSCSFSTFETLMWKDAKSWTHEVVCSWLACLLRWRSQSEMRCTFWEECVFASHASLCTQPCLSAAMLMSLSPCIVFLSSPDPTLFWLARPDRGRAVYDDPQICQISYVQNTKGPRCQFWPFDLEAIAKRHAHANFKAWW